MTSKNIFVQLKAKYYQLMINSVIYFFNDNGELVHYNSSYSIIKLNENGFEVREVIHCDEQGNNYMKNEVFFEGHRVAAIDENDKIIDAEIDVTYNDAYYKAFELIKDCKILIEGRVYDRLIEDEHGLYFWSEFTNQKFGIHSFKYDSSENICMIPKNNTSKQIPIFIVNNYDIKQSSEL